MKYKLVLQISCFMLHELIVVLTNSIINTISSLGYTGVFLLMAIQTMAVPIPSEIVIPFAGSLAAIGRFNYYFLCITASLGSLVGAMCAYFIGRKGGRPLVEKYGRMILLSKHDLDMADRFFLKYGSWAVFLGMALPVFRSFIAFPAGISRLPLKKFIPAVFFGSLVWCALLGYLGMKLGENWQTLREKFQGFDTLILLIILLGAGFWVYRHFFLRKEG